MNSKTPFRNDSGLTSYLVSLNTYADRLTSLDEENAELHAELLHEKAKPLALYACIFGATLAAFFAGLTLAAK
jgi:hypothetical protein